MDLKEFTSPLPKPWLNINCNSVTAETSSVGSVTTNELSLKNEASVPNPPVGYTTFFSNGTNYFSTNPVGATAQFAMSGDLSGYLPLTGGTMAGDINMGVHAVLNASAVSGPTNTRSADNIVSNSGAAAVGNLASFSSASGKVVQDSGVAVSSVLTEVDYDEIDNQLAPVAPAGIRDLYQPSNAIGAEMQYFAGPDMLYAESIVTASTEWSHDGGVTFTNCTFTVAPTLGVVIGYNGAGLWVGLEGAASAIHSYTSSDGKAFTANAGTLSVYENGNQIVWWPSSGLFVAGCITDATHNILTSPDGVTWTARVTPSMGANSGVASGEFATDGVTLAYASAQFSSGVIWSTDGITWNAATGGPVGSGSNGSCVICYSPDRAEWYVQNTADTGGFRSLDGRTWVSLGPFGDHTAQNTFWVANGINRYYQTTNSNPSTNVFSLSTTPSLSIPFVTGAVLDGAWGSASGYNVGAYLPAYDRFVIGSEQTGTAYSTARPLDIRATSNNIRVQGYPVATAMFSTYAPVAANSTTVETQMFPIGGTYVGYDVLQPGQDVGGMFRIFFNYLTTSGAGDTLTWRLKINSTTIMTFPVSVPAATNNADQISTTLTIQASHILCYMHQYSTGITLRTLSAYNPNIANSIQLTAQWTANVNQLSFEQANAFVGFMNGA
jgi:hypothetical protein